jgi:Na+-translocating ferredoxin:NAD+ oxidoreductase subunit D
MNRPQNVSLRAFHRLPHIESPFIRAPESPTKAFLEILLAATAPLLAGVVFFGFRAFYVATICVLTCLLTERIYYRVTRQLALASRTHAALTGILLALVLPAFVPWYVAAVGAVVAIILGKAVFGGVGHFIWQPALVGYLAVLVLFPTAMTVATPGHPDAWPILTRGNFLMGDVRVAQYEPHYTTWSDCHTRAGIDAVSVRRPEKLIAGLTRGEPTYSALTPLNRDTPSPYPTVLSVQPSVADILYGSIPGSIGETSVIVITIAGMLLIWRRFIKWQLPVAIIVSAGITAATAPIQLIGPDATIQIHTWPVLLEGLDVGLIYVGYQILTGGVFLAAFFLATETTTRPVTTGGQVLFGVGIGVIGMLLKLYTGVSGPFFIAVLAMNTLTPVIDRVWRARVYGRSRWRWFLGQS